MVFANPAIPDNRLGSGPLAKHLAAFFSDLTGS
jgi:hypothetical protein